MVGAKKLIWIICLLLKFERKKWIQNQFYVWFLLKASGLQFMVWQTNPIKIYLTVTFFCPPEKCGLMFLLKWWKIRLERKKSRINFCIIYKNNKSIFYLINSKKHEINHLRQTKNLLNVLLKDKKST